MSAPRVDGILVAVEQFLPPGELDFTTAYAAGMESNFSAATTVEMGRPGMINAARRRARVLTGIDTEEVGTLFKSRIEEVLPTVLQALRLPLCRARRISVQMTSTGDGGFYKPHSDNSPLDINRRVLSFVYFCNRYPVGFQGGDLRIYSTREYSEREEPSVQVHAISPDQNRIVFFRSDFIHEICPVVCTSKKLADTRLTVNGWIYFG
jgi:Rps23 Pro-64 3,4-dihydroxylase Tpa1-like proline 4-hydroxylase